MTTAIEVEVNAIRTQLNSLGLLVKALSQKIDGTASAPMVRDVKTAIEVDVIDLQERVTALETEIDTLSELIIEE